MTLRPIIACLCLAGLAACAGSGDVATSALTDVGGGPVAPGATSRPAGYALSEEEKGLDCRRLTGRMKIRILQIRDYHARAKTSELSRSLQSAQANFGASATGSDPDGDYARDRAMLEAYNAQLAAKGCKTLDLAAELKP